MSKVTGQGNVYWEDLAAGSELVGPGVTLTEAHLMQWAGLTGDWVSLHIDAEYAEGTAFGERIAHGPLTMSLGLGLLTQTGVFGNVCAWLGVDGVRACRPVLIGDTVHPEATVEVARPTKNPETGLWTLAYRVLNQRGETVMTFSSSLLIACRGEGGGPSKHEERSQ